jgi:hypothetical protein
VQDFVKAVQNESDQVADELRKVLDQLEPLMQERRRLEERAKALESVMSTYEGRGGRTVAVDTGDRHFLDVALEVLRAEGPLYYETLLQKVVERGARVPGRNPGANLIAHMTRDSRFKRVSRGTYAGAAVPSSG